MRTRESTAPWLTALAASGFLVATGAFAYLEEPLARNATGIYTAMLPAEPPEEVQPGAPREARYGPPYRYARYAPAPEASFGVAPGESAEPTWDDVMTHARMPEIPRTLVETVTAPPQEPLDSGFRAGSNRAITQERLGEIVAEAAEETGLDSRLIHAVVRTESDFRPAVISHAGAIGLMQVRPVAAAEVVSRIPDWQVQAAQGTAIDPDDLLDPRLNVIVGSHYLRHLYDHFEPYGEPMQLWLALAAYNWGVGNVRRHITSHPGLNDLQDLRWLIQTRAPQETRAFVHRVLERSGMGGDAI